MAGDAHAAIAADGSLDISGCGSNLEQALSDAQAAGGNRVIKID